MSAINNVDELKKALENGDDEIIISEKMLAGQVGRLRGLSKTAMVAIIVSAAFFVLTPVVGIATLGFYAVWLGRDVIEMIAGLGKENTRKLYFGYSQKKDDLSNLVLIKK
ncbi:MAG: hypothetical protein NTV54_15600 [Ignavibacteriales bacterium]|nr:hypothetical protein [Ignavibacteriales bacterium]